MSNLSINNKVNKDSEWEEIPQEIRDECENPDQPKEVKYEFGECVQGRILGAMVCSEDFLTHAINLVKPKYFIKETHQAICKALFKIGIANDKVLLRNELHTLIKNLPYQAMYDADLDTIIEMHSGIAEKQTYILGLITEFAKTQRVKIGFNDFLASPDIQQLHDTIGQALELGLTDDEKQFWTMSDVGQMQATKHLIRDHYKEGGLVYLLAESGTGKTYIALDMACCIASGKDYLGEHKTEQGAVVYVGQEGSDDNQMRAKAWAINHSVFLANRNINHIDVEDFPFYYVNRDFDLRTSAGSTELLSIIDNLDLDNPPKLIVLDTVCNMLAGGNDSDPADMGGFITSCQTLIAKTGAAVLAIAHPGHLDKTRPRGFSNQKPACDTVILATGGVKKGIGICFTKQKGWSPMDDYKLYTTHIDHVAEDSNGNSVSNLVLCGKQDKVKYDWNKLHPTAKLLMNTLASKFGMNEFTWAAARDAAKNELVCCKDDEMQKMPSSTFGRWWKELHKNYLYESGTGKSRIESTLYPESNMYSNDLPEYS